MGYSSPIHLSNLFLLPTRAANLGDNTILTQGTPSSNLLQCTRHCPFDGGSLNSGQYQPRHAHEELVGHGWTSESLVDSIAGRLLSSTIFFLPQTGDTRSPSFLNKAHELA